MAQLINLKLSRHDQSSPWGFRLQGGKDFGTPLLIQKVNFGSLAEKFGLQVGDALVRVNGQDVYDVKHKDAQDIILRAGNDFELTIQRGGTSTWKPSVTPIGPSPVPSRLSHSPQLVTKTSLARVGPQSPAFGSSHNSVSRPFSSSPKVGNGCSNDSGTVKAIVNKQYNTPVGIYSEENIAETLTAQAEVLAGGVLGVNFKKNEKNYEVNQSEVFKMVQEADKEPKDLETETDLHAKFAYFSAASHAIGSRAVSPRPATPRASAINMPEQREPYLGSPLKEVDKCAENAQPVECRKDIIGVFVRIKDKSLHVECFKCATCGSSLKNVGYFNINNKLYCDIHAKMVAKQNPPSPHLEPVTVAPGSHPPLGAFNIIPTKSKEVQSVQSPQPSTLSPIPFHTSSTVFSNAKPYEAPKQTSTPPTGGFNQIQSNESKNSLHSQPRLPFLKPKQSTGSAFCPVISKPLLVNLSNYPNPCTQVYDPLNQCKQTLCNSISTQMLIESTKEKSQSPTPNHDDFETVMIEVPHKIQSLLPPNNNVRAISPTHMVIFPPEIPPEYRTHSRSKTSTPKLNHQTNIETIPECTFSFDVNQVKSTLVEHTVETFDKVQSSLLENDTTKVISPTHSIVFPPEISHGYTNDNRSKTYSPHPTLEINDIETTPKLEVSIGINQVESTISHYSVECMEIKEQNYTEQYEDNEKSKTRALSTIQDQSTPQISTMKSKCPTLVADNTRVESPMIAALKTAPERSYSPLPTFVDAREFIPKPPENPVKKDHLMTMADALAIAPKRSYKLPESSISTRPIGNNPVRYMHGYNKKSPVVPLLMTRSLIYTPESAIDSEEEQIAILGLKSFPPVSDELKWSTAAGDFDRKESNFEYVEELVFDVPKTEKLEELIKEKIVVEEPSKPLPKHPFTASGLHEPLDIPRYQQSIPENPHRATPSDKTIGKLIGPGIKDKASMFTPKSSIKNASFLKQEANVHAKVAPTLGYKPTSLEGGPSKILTHLDPMASNSAQVSSSKTFISTTSTLDSPSLKKSIPETPKSFL